MAERAGALAVPAARQAGASPAARAAGAGGASAPVPWVLYPILAASAAILIGLVWDISWHRTIGRDTFWSPPHVLEQLAAAVAGLTCGWLVLRTTFAGTEAERAGSVRFWGLRGPLGAWVCIWGTLMMITSAPFDDWWHNAYGLDVKIISPPHMVLAAGMVAIQIGAMLLAVSAQNRWSGGAGAGAMAAGATAAGAAAAGPAAAGGARATAAAAAGAAGDGPPTSAPPSGAPPRAAARLGFLHAASAGILLGMAAVMIMEDASFPNRMRDVQFYRMTAVVMPVFLLAAARASRLRWPATTAAAVYMAVQLGMIWTLQLFPATPRLAPIYNPVTHMVPPPFPLLLVFPAIGLDLLLRRFGRPARLGPMHDWALAAVAGALFVGVMAAVHWYWADFLLSPAARNFVFGADRWDYNVRPGPWQYQYWNPASGAALFQGLAWAALYAAVSARVGLWWGRGMARVRR